MTISRMLQPRQQYGLGSLVKSAVKGVTGAVKGVASGIKDFAKSDLGKVQSSKK
jgi:phage-related protein